MTDDYNIKVQKARLGWWARVTMTPHYGAPEPGALPMMGIALEGPIYWRPTQKLVLHRAGRHVARRRKVDERASEATEYLFPAHTEESG